jgi:hypothetical protein
MEEEKQLPLFSDEEDITSPLRKIRPMSNVETHFRGELVVIGNVNDTKICCDCNQEKNISFFPTSNGDNYGRLYTKKYVLFVMVNIKNLLENLKKHTLLLNQINV